MKIMRLILLFALLISSLWLLSKRLNVFPMHDFVEYWASGRLNFSGGDPYDADQMYKLEQSVGWNEKEVLMMWNPPWTLTFGMAFGLLDYSFSRLMWFLVQLCVIFFCAIVLWRTFGGEKRYEWIAWIAVLGFGPILHTLKLGQVTVLVLLGSVGFIFFIQREQDFWAGVMASLALIKPHLLYLFLLAVLFWSIDRRRYKLLLGLVGSTFVAFGISWIVNPSLIAQYLHAIQSYPPEDWITATLSSPLRILLGSDKFYLQFLPSIIGTTWFLYFWLKRHKTWNWSEILPLLILISTVTTAYGWAFDVAVCVWAVVQIAVLFDFKVMTSSKVLILVAYWSVSLLNAFLSVSQHFFWWLSSFYLLWYLLSYRYLVLKKITPPQESITLSA